MPSKRSLTDWILESIAAAALIWIAVTVCTNWSDLPARIPRHFGMSGRPDGWGGKSGIFVLPGVAAISYALLTAAARYQSLINIPISIDRGSPEVQRLLQSLVIAIKAVMLLVFAYLERTVVNTALGRSSGLGKAFLPLSLIAIFAVLGFYLRELRRTGRRSAA